MSLVSTLPRHALRATDFALVSLVLAIVILMVIPVPLLLLDFLIAVNIGLSLALLLLTLYVPTALSLSTFPTLLLFTTLLRLSLNIASTKSILLVGDGGHIIETFGKLVVGGNVMVGLVVFLIIAIVQFIVIAKGSERVAEVGARFSLDGMPGKQMSIDADLRAGLLTKEAAQQKRMQLERESQLNGALDGAMKFVKGDAVAGLVITAVNIVGGIAIGMLMKDMTLAASADRFVLLAVGDGLVSQIPSLFVSIAAGVLITRGNNQSATGSDLGGELARQLTAQPLAIFFTGVIMVLFVLVPGFPKLVFLVLGVALIAFALLSRSRARRPRSVGDTLVEHMRPDGQTDAMPLLSRVNDPVAQAFSLRLHPKDLERIDVRAFDAALGAMRASVRRQTGLPFPGLRVVPDETAQPGQVQLSINEVPAAEGRIDWGQLIGLPSLFPSTPFVGDPFEPTQGGTAATVLVQASAEQWLACVVGRVWVRDGEMFVGMQEVQRLLESTAKSYPGLVEEAMRTLPLQRIADVYRRLVQEQVSIFHQREILESLLTWGPREKDVVMLTEYVRADLGRMTAFRHTSGEKVLPCLALSPALEAEIRAAVQQSQVGYYLALSPEQSMRIVQSFEEALHHAGRGLSGSVVVCSMDIRRYVRKLLVQSGLQLPVLSHQELGLHVKIQVLAQVETGRAPAVLPMKLAEAS